MIILTIFINDFQKWKNKTLNTFKSKKKYFKSKNG